MSLHECLLMAVRASYCMDEGADQGATIDQIMARLKIHKWPADRSKLSIGLKAMRSVGLVDKKWRGKWVWNLVAP